MATTPLFGRAGFVYETPGGVLRTHRLRWPLRDVEPVHRRRRFVWESMDFSTRRTVNIGGGASELLATIRYEDLPEDLIEMLVHAADGVEIEYREDLDVASTATPFLLILDDPTTVHLAMDRDRYASHGEYEVRLRLRRLDGYPPLPINSNLLKNPGFEEGGAYWSSATASREYLDDPTLAYTGRGCAQITVTSGGGQDAIAQTDGLAGGGSNVFFPVTPGDLITFGVWTYRVSGTGFIRPRIWPYDANKQGLPPGQINGPSRSETGEWVLSTMDWTVPEGVAFVRYDLQVLNSPTVARFDDVYLRIRRAS